MGRAYAQDLRDRVIAAVEAGQSRNAAAERFGVSVSCAVKWLQRYHRDGSRTAKKMGGNRPFALAAHRVFVLRRLSETPDLTITALTEELATRGIKVSRFAVWHFLQHERLSFKKKDSARRRARSPGRRQAARPVAAATAQAGR